MKLIAFLAALSLPISVALAQQPGHDHGPASAPASEPIAPRIGDMMLMQQIRHLKLWFAGRERNWELAAFSVDELKEGFEDVAKLLGGDTVEKAVEAPLAALEKAVEAKDRNAFTAAYDKLTEGCNACHRTLNHAFVVIKRPTSQPFTNQSFAPARK